MASKVWQRFEGKTRNLQSYLQLIDLSLNLANKQCKKGDHAKRIADVLGSNIIEHQQLNIPNQGADIGRTFVTARNMLHEHAIVEMYAVFSDYLANCISEIVKIRPQNFFSIVQTNKDSRLDFPKIVSLGSYDSILNEMSRIIYRQLESLRSTKEELDKLIQVFDLHIAPNTYSKALAYMEIRHLIIHNNTKADEKFKEMNNAENIVTLLSGSRIKLDYSVSNQMIQSVRLLCQEIDNELIRVNALVAQ